MRRRKYRSAGRSKKTNWKSESKWPVIPVSGVALPPIIATKRNNVNSRKFPFPCFRYFRGPAKWMLLGCLGEKGGGTVGRGGGES